MPLKLQRRPQVLSFRWSPEDLDAFKDLRRANSLWQEWLKTNTPSDEQLYRKLLMDLNPDYRQARHFGADFDTLDPRYSEFNECTGSPIESDIDYIERCAPWFNFLDNEAGAPSADFGNALFAFVVHGGPKIAEN